MQTLPKYASYTKTDINWIEEFPSHWKLVPCRSIVEHIVEKNENAKIQNYLSLMANIGVIRYEDKGDVGNKKPEDLSKCKIVRKGQLVINSMNYSIGSYGMSPYDGVCSSDYIVLEAKKDVLLNRYGLRVFENSAFQKHLATFGNGILAHRAAIGWDDIKGAYIPLAPMDEQENILKFLDYETAQIDTLIDKQQTLITLLKEKRQAVISHAVTKGLNPDAPMKDSGVEWLGEVPEHWGVIQAKYIADITRGAILRPVDAPEYFDEDGEWAYLNISDATKCDKYLYESKLRLSPLGSRKSARVYPNNLIITASATIGKAFINKVKVCIHDGFIPFCNIKVDINYLYHYVSNPYLYAAMGKSNTQKNIYLDEVKNMVVTVPPRVEQESIVEHIEKNQNKYSKLIDEAEKAIQLMQERRTALISAAVTGKIDVRGWVAPE